MPAQIKGFEKFKIIIVLSFMSAVAPLSTDMYLPALPSVQHSFETSEFLTQLSLASFFIAFALGQLIYGPLSDVFGRKKLACIGIVLFIFSSFTCVIVDNVYVFVAFRFLQGLGGCAGVVIARAVANDLFELKEAASVFALMIVVTSLAPMLSPFFGSILLGFFAWKSIFMALFILGILLLCFIVFGLKESAPNLKGVKFSHKDTIKRYKKVICDKIFLIYVFSGGLVMAAMFAYITGSSFVFMQFFGLSEKSFSLLFAFNALGFVICANINAKIVLKISPFKILTKAFLMIFLSAILLLIFGSFKIFLGFEIALFLNIAMLGFLLPNITTLAMARFKDMSGTASAVLGTSQFAFAGLLAFIVGLLNANNPLILALVMSVCIISGCVLYFYFAKKLSQILK